MHERRYGVFKLSAGLAQLLCLCWTWCLSDLLLSAGLRSAGEHGQLWKPCVHRTLSFHLPLGSSLTIY